MAEALGLAASVIAVVDVAAKTGSAYVRIQKLWSEVKNVPNLLREKAEDIQIFEEYLANVEDNLAISPLPALAADRILLEKLIGRCRSALHELSEIVDRIYSRVVKERGLKHRIASAKAALKKDDLEAISTKFDRALQMFQMAQAEERRHIAIATYNAIMASNADGLLGCTNGTTATAIKPPSQIIRNVQEKQTRSRETQMIHDIVSETSLLGRFGKLRFEFGPQGGFHALVAAPSWLSKSVYSMIAQRETLGWQFSLRAHELIQSFGREVHQSLEDDDSRGLMKHLQSRRIGLFARQEIGFNLLTLAALYGSLNIVKELTSLGVRVMTGQSFREWIIIRFLDDPPPIHGHPNHAMIHILGDNGLDDLLDVNGLAWALSDGISFKCFEILWLRRAQDSDWAFAERSRLLRAIAYSVDGHWWTLDQFFFLVSENSICNEAWLVHSRAPGNFSLLHSVAVGAIQPLLNDDNAADQSRWAQILADCVRLDPLGLQHADPRGPNKLSAGDLFDEELLDGELPDGELPDWEIRPAYTPLSALIVQTWAKHKNTSFGQNTDFSLHLERILQFWVNMLASAGIDLLEYGRLEKRFHSTERAGKFLGFVSRTLSSPRGLDNSNGPVFSGDRRYFVAGFTYGRLPEHWKLWITFENYEYAGDFWGMIEAQATFIPGSWVPDPIDKRREIWEWWDREGPPLIWSEYRKIKPPI